MTPNDLNVLEAMPEGVDYTDDLADLDVEDIPRERIPLLEDLLRGDDEFTRLRAGLLLTSWGQDSGLSYLRALVENSKGEDLGWVPHRLRSYDETYTQIYHSLEYYWAIHSEGERSNEVKADLLPLFRRLIEYSSVLQFALPMKFILLHARFLELIPDLRLYFRAILDRPEWHHWKVIDAVELLKEVDHDFVVKELAQHGTVIGDYSL